MSEAQIQKQIVEYLQAHDAMVFRMNAGKVRARNGFVQQAPPGTPDLLVVDRWGQAIWIEVKAPGGKLNPAQVAMHEQLERRGSVVVVATCVEDLVKLFD